MSRIGKIPVKVPKEVKVTFENGSAVTSGPKGKLSLKLPFGIKVAQKDDLFLLCSDGLSGVVDESTMKKIFTAESDLEAACRALIDTANERGGPDNVSAVLIRIVET